jgi:hypothetical protein
MVALLLISCPEDYLLASELRELQKLYLAGKSKEEIIQIFPKVDPELLLG